MELNKMVEPYKMVWTFRKLASELVKIISANYEIILKGVCKEGTYLI